MSKLIKLKEVFEANKQYLTKEDAVSFAENILSYAINREEGNEQVDELIASCRQSRDESITNRIALLFDGMPLSDASLNELADIIGLLDGSK